MALLLSLRCANAVCKQKLFKAYGLFMAEVLCTKCKHISAFRGTTRGVSARDLGEMESASVRQQGWTQRDE